MGMLIQKPGLLATFQDLGRRGFGRFGVNPGGVIDTAAARIANALCGNSDSEPVLEMNFPAPEIKFTSDCVFVLSGADLDARLNGSPIVSGRLRSASVGDVVSFAGRRSGAIAYLAVRGGFLLEDWLGSLGTNLAAGMGGFHGRAVRKGDQVEFGEDHSAAPRLIASHTLFPFYTPFPTVRFVRGPEHEIMTDRSAEVLRKITFSVSANSNRMGFRLSGPELSPKEPFEMISSGVNFGTIQLLPDGRLIILMADHQTTGGYPRIATIIPTDLPLVAQLVPGDKIGFHEVTLEDAENLFFEFERDLNLLRTACKFKLDAQNRP